MSFSRIDGFRIAGVSTCVPPTRVDNLDLGELLKVGQHAPSGEAAGADDAQADAFWH